MPPRKSKGRQGSEAPAIPTGRGPWRVDRLVEQTLESQIKDIRPARVFLSSGAPRALGSRPALHTRGNREKRQT